ncbi:MAG: hypothetical protein J6M60_04840 [Clostridia bacterium]|nr:hypothetical protein [Clostridia bacterium]
MAFIEHEFHMTVRDIDKNTNLTNKAILSFFEDIGGYHSNLAGFGLKQIEASRLSWVLLHWKLKVIKRVKYNGIPLKVKTWSRGVERTCTFRDFEIYDSNGDLCVVGSSKWTLIHLEKGLMRLNDDLLINYEAEEKKAIPDFEFKKIQEPESYSNEFDYTVLRRDLDINGHMHNLNYIDLAYEALPKDIYENHSFDDVEIMYKKGAFLGDKLKCLYSNVNNEHIVTIKSEDEKNLHAIVKLS